MASDAEYERIRGTYVYKRGDVPDKSRKTPGALRGTQRDAGGHLVGHAEFFPDPDDDDDDDYDDGDDDYDDGDDDGDDELTSLVAGALGTAGALLVVSAGSHIKSWWNDRSRRNLAAEEAQQQAIAQEAATEYSARMADAAEESVAWQQKQALSQQASAEQAARMADAAQESVAWQQEQARAQWASAKHSERIADAAERQVWIAQRAAEDKRWSDQRKAEQDLRVQFGIWRQTPNGRVYEQWKQQATFLANVGVMRVRRAMDFQPEVTAAHQRDVYQCRRLHPGPATRVLPPSARVLPAEHEKLSLVIGALPVVGGLVEELREKKEREAAAKYELEVDQWRGYQAACRDTDLARARYLRGASLDPNQPPDWWTAAVLESGFMPTPEAIQGYERWAMREFPSPNQLPKLAQVSFRVRDSVAGGPEVQKAVAWYRWQDRSNRVPGITGRR